jgi:glutathione S-transferase
MSVVVHGFQTSNNMKVRVALGYKGIAYEFRAIDPANRDAMVRISGQPLTPVLEHDGRVLFDSAAILRYLDANFPDTPKLFGDSHGPSWEIEDWELFARSDLAGPVMEVVHTRVLGGDVDDAMTRRCAGTFAEAVTRLSTGLEGRRWLVGDSMTAADITAACVVHRVRSAELFALPGAASGLTDWVDRVMAFDAHR